MLTKEQAVEVAFAYFKQHDIDEKRQPDIVHLITRKAVVEGAAAMELKRRRPDAWRLLEQTARDHWCIMFETEFASPPYDIVEVDAETGKVTTPDLL